VENVFGRLRLLGCNVGLRLRYSNSHLNYLPEDLVVGKFPVGKKKVKIIIEILKG